MIWWICVHIGLDRINNELIREQIEVVPVEDKMRGQRLGWCVHIRSIDARVYCVRTLTLLNVREVERDQKRIRMR